MVNSKWSTQGDFWAMTIKRALFQLVSGSKDQNVEPSLRCKKIDQACMQLSFRFQYTVLIMSNDDWNQIIHDLDNHTNRFKNLYYYSYIFSKSVRLCSTHLIGQNHRAVCKRHGLSWICIQGQEVHSTSLSIHVWAERNLYHCTRKRGHRASCEASGSVTVLYPRLVL